MKTENIQPPCELGLIETGLTTNHKTKELVD